MGEHDAAVEGGPGLTARLRELEAAHAALIVSEQRFRVMFEESPLGIAMSDERGLLIQLNTAMCRVLGRPAHELLGRSGAEFAHPDDLSLHAGVEQSQRASAEGIVCVETRHLHPDGSYRWLEMTITATRGPTDQQWTLLYGQDITERKNAEIALRDSRSILAAIATISQCVTRGADPRPVVVDAVRSLCQPMSVALVEVGADGAPTILGDREGPHGLVASSPVTAHVWATGAQQVRRSDVPPCTTLWQPVMVQDEVVAVLVVSWASDAMTASSPQERAVVRIAGEAGTSLHAARLRTELEASANSDPMTGSLNRRAWEVALRDLTARARDTGRPLAVALLDLDHFKAYNDTFGHNEGDVLLQTFAEGARSTLRVGDVFARWGGEEFILALPDCSRQHAAALLHRVKAQVPAGQTCSIGAAQWDVVEPMSVCIARADAALYEAKNNGRNRLAFR